MRWKGARIRALHATGRPLGGTWAEDWPHYLDRLQKQRFSSDDQLVTMGFFSPADRRNWAVARQLGLRIVTEIFGPTMDAILQDFHREGLLGPDNIFNHCTGLSSETWQILRDAGVNVNVCPRSDAQYAMDEGMFAYQNAVDHGIRPAISIDTETSYGGDMFAEMRVAFSLQRAAAQKLRYAGYVHAPIRFWCRNC